MSSRVLRKLQGENDFAHEPQDEGNSDPDVNLSGSGGARKKQLHINRYDLLNQQSHSESEVKEDDDHETEPANAQDGINDERDTNRRKKKKKRKKKSGKSLGGSNRISSDDNLELGGNDNHVTTTDKEDFLLAAPVHQSTGLYSNGSDRTGGRPALGIKHKNLNPNNELRRIFGSKIIQSEQSKRRGRGRPYVKCTWLITARENWPPVSKSGISMRLEKVDGVQYFTYEHNANYQQVQKRFLEAVDSLNPDNIVAVINSNPYHVDALIQLSDLCKMSEDLQMAAELNERALYCLECAFHPMFSLAKGNCRLNYRRQENRALFITLYKHLTFVGQRACYRTALELCKLLLSLDFEEDPLGVILCIDFYALRSRKYAWLVMVSEEWEACKNLSQLPNFAFSHALAHFHIVGGGEYGELTMADNLLQTALIMFPGVLTSLLDKCSIQIDPRVSSHAFFTTQAMASQSPSLTQLVQLYVCRTYHEWKDPALLPWLERNVHKVLDRADSGDQFIKDCEQKRKKRYQGTPRNVVRHILLSDIKEVRRSLSDVEPVLSFDPLPPLDSINIYTRPQRPRMYEHSNSFSMFFRSLLPNFNINEPAGPPVDLQLMVDAAEEIEGGAGAGAGATGVDLRNSVTSLLDAMRDLLSNIHLQDVNIDADGEVYEDLDTDDEQEHEAVP